MRRIFTVFTAAAAAAGLLFASEAFAQEGTIQSFVDELAVGKEAPSRFVDVGLGAAWNGTFRVAHGRAIADRFTLAAFVSYTDSERSAIRDEADDWEAKAFLGGLSLRFYPAALAKTYRGYFLSLDAALSVARHTYEPDDESDTFIYPAFDFYPAGYTVRLSDRFRVDALAGVGYAPAGDHVEIGEQVNDADVYALADLRVSYWW
ncbi:MAG: hypothetical protein JW958_09305 [Candidatus Eisenbacteria bacterium]|nr:hypothetical protein [Candidatus Eisenbacteria bacterium]